jgi:hypothetical protein
MAFLPSADVMVVVAKLLEIQRSNGGAIKPATGNGAMALLDRRL